MLPYELPYARLHHQSDAPPMGPRSRLLRCRNAHWLPWPLDLDPLPECPHCEADMHVAALFIPLKESP